MPETPIAPGAIVCDAEGEMYLVLAVRAGMIHGPYLHETHNACPAPHIVFGSVLGTFVKADTEVRRHLPIEDVGFVCDAPPLFMANVLDEEDRQRRELADKRKFVTGRVSANEFQALQAARRATERMRLHHRGALA